MCIEVEEPFGEDANDLPMRSLHRHFVHCLESIFFSEKPERPGLVVRRMEDTTRVTHFEPPQPTLVGHFEGEGECETILF